MNKPQTPEEILKLEHKGYSNEQLQMPGNRRERNFWHKEDIIPAMKEHARQAVRVALEDAVDNAEVDDYSGAKSYVIKDSILSRESEILKKLGIEPLEK